MCGGCGSVGIAVGGTAVYGGRGVWTVAVAACLGCGTKSNRQKSSNHLLLSSGQELYTLRR